MVSLVILPIKVLISEVIIMLHGFGKFWNMFSFFWRKMLDALLLGTICHYAVRCFTGKEIYELSGVVLLAAMAAGFVLSIVRAVRIARPANKDKDLLVFNKQPEAINVRRSRRSSIDVKTHRGAKMVVKHALIVILGSAAYSVSLAVTGCDFEKEKGSWIPGVVLVGVCVYYNVFVCKSFKHSKCPLCKRRKAIKLSSKELLEKTIGDWTENVDVMDFYTDIYNEYLVGPFGRKEYIGQKEVTTPRIRTHGKVYHNIELGRFLKHYVCRYCGQQFQYEAKDFEPINKI